jgi:hypothetical protein
MTLFPFTGGGMPWRGCHVMDERLRFVARLLEGEKMPASHVTRAEALETAPKCRFVNARPEPDFK